MSHPTNRWWRISKPWDFGVPGPRPRASASCTALATSSSMLSIAWKISYSWALKNMDPKIAMMTSGEFLFQTLRNYTFRGQFRGKHEESDWCLIGPTFWSDNIGWLCWMPWWFNRYNPPVFQNMGHLGIIIPDIWKKSKQLKYVMTSIILGKLYRIFHYPELRPFWDDSPY